MTASSPALAIINATIVTGDADGSVIPDHTIIVDAHGQISRVGPSAQVEVPSGIRTIDATGKFVTPGLINAHGHFFSDGKPISGLLTNPKLADLAGAAFHSLVGNAIIKRKARQNILTEMQSGVTTVRSLGDARYEVVDIANEIEDGKYLGPRVLASGPLLAISGGHGAPQIALISDNPWEARKNVRKNLARGVGAIKIAATGGVTDSNVIGEAGRPQMTVEEMTAICEEAHNAGLVVAAHAQSPQGVLNALRAGVDTIEHGSSMTQEIIDLYRNNPKSLRGWSAFVPTLAPVMPLVTFDGDITGLTKVRQINSDLIYKEMLQGIKDAVANDIVVGAGNDSAMTFVTHYDFWREMDFMVRYGGVTTTQALHFATQANARILNLEAITGKVEEGLSADLVIVNENPLDNLSTFANPQYVVVRGEVLDHPRPEHFQDVDKYVDQI